MPTLTLSRSPLPVLVLAVIMFRRRNVRTLYKEPTDEMRDTIINYDDEGGGEKDQTAYDLSVLQVANGPNSECCRLAPNGSNGGDW